MSADDEFARLLQIQERRYKYHKLDYYKPYGFQKDFHNAKGFKTDKPAIQKVLQSGNGVGKTLAGSMDTAFHLTGRYPDWWQGHRFRHPPLFMIGGNTNEAVMNISQKALFGDPNEPQALGSGSVPIDCIGKTTGKTGVPNAFDAVLVKHRSGGWAKTLFRAYEQGPRKHMGYRIDGGWLDEEPPQDIWSQYLRATVSTGGVLSITYTPETGLTEVVNSFMNNLQRGQAMVMAEWKDAPHLVSKDGELSVEAQQLLDSFPPHEREMRRRGVPTYGRGLVFPFTDDQLLVEPFEIPRHWPRIIGIDFGWDHPFAAAQLAWDRDSDIVYLISEYRESRTTPAIHAAAVKPWGKWPVAWPHDGLNTEKGTGDELRQAYVDEGLDLLPFKATNQPQAGEKEGEGGNSPEAAILKMYERMDTGRWKVFKTCRLWREESRIYHRASTKDGDPPRLVKLRDDLISACLHPDTKIITRHGPKRIVDMVGTTGEVLSAGKWSRYSACFMTRRNAPLVSVEFDDGYSVLCTPEHRFMTDEGWIEAQHLEGMLCHNAVSHGGGATWKKNSSTASGLRGLAITGAAPENSCIEQFGNFITALSRMAITFIIGMKTGKITTFQTLSPRKVDNTFLITREGTSAVRSPRSLLWCCGENLPKAISICRKWGNAIITSCVRILISCAPVAGGILSPRLQAPIGFAQMHARQNTGEQAVLIKSPPNVPPVEPRSWQINLSCQNAARTVARESSGSQLQKAKRTSRALRVRNAGRSDVYCLSVPETESFAIENGVLVHNSRYGFMMLRWARTEVIRRKSQNEYAGATNWS